MTFVLVKKRESEERPRHNPQFTKDTLETKQLTYFSRRRCDGEKASDEKHTKLGMARGT